MREVKMEAGCVGDLPAVLYRRPREEILRQVTLIVNGDFDKPDDMSYHVIERITVQSVITKGGRTFTKRQVRSWMKEQPYRWSKENVDGAVAIDCRVRIGDMYQPQFRRRIPPFYDLVCTSYDSYPMPQPPPSRPKIRSGSQLQVDANDRGSKAKNNR